MINEENERESRGEYVSVVDQEVKISWCEVRRTLKMKKSGRTDGLDDIPVEVWTCQGEVGAEFLMTRTFNAILESEKMSEE